MYKKARLLLAHKCRLPSVVFSPIAGSESLERELKNRVWSHLLPHVFLTCRARVNNVSGLVIIQHSILGLFRILVDAFLGVYVLEKSRS